MSCIRLVVLSKHVTECLPVGVALAITVAITVRVAERLPAVAQEVPAEAVLVRGDRGGPARRRRDGSLRV